MKHKQLGIFCLILTIAVLFAGCAATTNQGGSATAAPETEPIEDNNEVEIKTAEAVEEYTLIESADGNYTYQSADGKETATLTVTVVSGSDSYKVEGNTLIIENLTEDTEIALSGVFYGNIAAYLSDDVKLTLALCGLTLYSSNEAPIAVTGGDKVTISAKKETENLLFDLREEVTDEDAIASAIYVECDLDLQGKGSLYVTSENNNGIHTKDDLKVKNLTLQVDCLDNALKGNDSVTIESGKLTLIARQGDGIKTKNSDLSSKGKQRGTVLLSGGDILIYAAEDGIDAAYNVEIEDTEALNLQIFTANYSTYTESASVTQSGATLINTATGSSGFGQGNGNRQGTFGAGGGKSGFGGQGGFGGMIEGNQDKSDVSSKAIKADNEVLISGGDITISAYDDAIHANSDVELENGETPTGNIAISGGTIRLASNDDGIHADGTLAISGGTISVTKCYEGLEGTTVVISGGTISVIASDDGVNAKATSGRGIVISGGYLYVYASGDGLDSNSRTDYEGIVISGGNVVVISTSGGNSPIDSERGYTYSGGNVIAVGQSGGMSQESLNCNNFSSVGTSKNLSLKSGEYLVAKGVATVKIPTSMNAIVILLGNKNADISTSSSTDQTLDGNGVWIAG